MFSYQLERHLILPLCTDPALLYMKSASFFQRDSTRAACVEHM